MSTPILLAGMALLGQADPLAAPPEVHQWARRATGIQPGVKPKLQALLTAIFAPTSEGGTGLGITYDNSRTRSVAEVWQDRKANCLSLTAFYTAACRSLGIEARPAEPLNTNRWRRSGSMIRFERHVVAVVSLPPLEEVVADFLPQLRKRTGYYLVNIMTEARFRSLYHSNRAVEALDAGEKAQAEAEADLAIRVDPTSSVGWNIRGVVLNNLDRKADAETCFRRAIALDPRDGTPVGNMEMLARGLGRFEEAIHFRALGMDLRKKDPYYHAFLADEAMEEGRWADAAKEVKAALKIQPYESEFHLLQVRIHLQEGKADAAMESLEKARRWAIREERDRYDSKIAALKQQRQ
ncbi:MAG: tetratricopeptide repeat protein [Acidobacteria bacterium]|nr:tetratricopeptide repeat protein [Acidobacteriota bacterium]